MLGEVLTPKYYDPGSPVINIHITNYLTHRTFIHLGETINVMNKETMEKLNLQEILRQIPIVLYIVDRYIANPKGMLEDVVVSIDSWEYPTCFMVLQTKFGIVGYLLILSRSLLVTTNSCIIYILWDMTITHGQYLKKLIVYPSLKPFLEA
jgi:hypothetical protein